MSRPLTLYHLRSCPFCHRVRRAAAELQIDLHLVDIDEVPAAWAYLQAQRGRTTVPVLGIPSDRGEILMPESSDIIDYLRTHAAELRAA